MTLTAGIDVGSSAVKMVLVRHGTEGPQLIARRTDKVRHRDIVGVVEAGYRTLLKDHGLASEDIAYVATTGEGEMVSFRTGHFYGMTAHGRGGFELAPDCSAVLDAGALHARAILIDGTGRVTGYRMTSQCASGSGQFIENISRYLGVALEEVGALSTRAHSPEKCSSICAVLAETDVINMVSRGIAVEDILKGIHQSMAGRFVKLLRAAGARNHKVIVTGGLANDTGLIQAMREEAERAARSALTFVTHPASVYAGAYGAALWGHYRLEKLGTDRFAHVQPNPS